MLSAEERGESRVNLQELRSKLLNLVSKPFRGYVEKRVSEGVLDWLLEFVRPDDLVYAIEHDEDLISMFVRCIVSSFREQVSEVLSPESVFRIMREKRPDLASIIVSMPNGIEWLTRSAEKVREMAEKIS